MNREIKFRGRRIDNGEWIYGSLLDGDIIVAGPVDADGDYIGVGEWSSVDKDTVGQYTGLKDRNGKEIYEGSILNEQLAQDRDFWKQLYEQEHDLCKGQKESLREINERIYADAQRVIEENERLRGELEDQTARANIAQLNSEAKSERMTELHQELKQLKAERDDYRKGIKHYADRRNHPPFWLHDDGQLARDILSRYPEKGE